jgi:hypothetical protein
LKSNHQELIAMKLFSLLIFLSMGQLAHAQYVYFNNLYEVDNQSISINYKIFELADSTYLNLGEVVDMNENSFQVGTFLRSIDYLGNQISRINIELPIAYPAGGGILNESVLQLMDNSIIQFHTISNGMQGYAPLLFRIDAELDTVWTKAIMIGATPPNEDGHANEIYGCGLSETSDTSFMLLTWNRWGWSAQPDSLKLRYITFDYNGQAIEEHATPMPEDLTPNGIRKLSENQLLVWGTLYENNDRQVFVWKTDMHGNVLDSLIVGNSSEPDGELSELLIDNDNSIVFAYMKCLFHNGNYDNLFELHVVRLNPLDLAILEESIIEIDGYEDSEGGASVLNIIHATEGGYLLNTGRYINSNTTPRVNFIRLDGEFNLIWQNAYTAGYTFYSEFAGDVIEASDGGFVATGTTEVIYDDFSVTQKNWIFKIDACGYEEPMGCPAVVDGVEQHMAEEEILLWPNPCNNILKARLPNSVKEIRIIDQTGRIVMQENVYFPNQEWNVGAIGRGIYLLETIHDNGMVTSKRIVKG